MLGYRQCWGRLRVALGHEFVVLLKWDAFSSALKLLEYLHFMLILMMLEDLQNFSM